MTTTVHCYQIDPKRKYRTVELILNFRDRKEAWAHVDKCGSGHSLK